jgi:hypothetical protein
VTDGVVAEVSRLSAAADLVAAFTQRGSGRPRKVLEADMVYLLALNYQEIFGRLPPRSERSAFAEFVRAALEEAGQPAQVKNLIRQALDRAES